MMTRMAKRAPAIIPIFLNSRRTSRSPGAGPAEGATPPMAAFGGMVAASARGLCSEGPGLSSAPGDPGRTAAGLVAGGLPRLPRGLLFLGISLSPVLLLQGLHPGYIGLVLPLPKGGGEPGIQDFPGYGLRGGTQA